MRKDIAVMHDPAFATREQRKTTAAAICSSDYMARPARLAANGPA